MDSKLSFCKGMVVWFQNVAVNVYLLSINWPRTGRQGKTQYANTPEKTLQNPQSLNPEVCHGQLQLQIAFSGPTNLNFS